MQAPRSGASRGLLVAHLDRFGNPKLVDPIESGEASSVVEVLPPVFTWKTSLVEVRAIAHASVVLYKDEPPRSVAEIDMSNQKTILVRSHPVCYFDDRLPEGTRPTLQFRAQRREACLGSSNKRCRSGVIGSSHKLDDWNVKSIDRPED